MKPVKRRGKLGRLKKSLLSLIMLVVLSFIGYGVYDQPEDQIVYDESAFEEDVYEVEGEELALLEGELTDDAYAEDEMQPISSEELESLEKDTEEDENEILEEPFQEESRLDKDGSYTSKDDVAEYIYTYGELPSNYITKEEAQELGWVSSEGNLHDVAPGKSIGGGKFGNYEGMLPIEDGRQYYECDIDYEGGYRNEKRVVYSNDGLIFYTEDHYETFFQLY